MIVLIANYLPDAVRGKIKLWFIEPRPNVFVSGVKDSLAMAVVNMLMEYCPPKSGLIIFQSISTPPFFQIFTTGQTSRKISDISGLQLVVEKKLPEINNVKSDP